jgi:hypothetical protein
LPSPERNAPTPRARRTGTIENWHRLLHRHYPSLNLSIQVITGGTLLPHMHCLETFNLATQYSSPEEILLKANALFRAEQSDDIRAVIAEKIEDLRHYDVLRFERVAAILCMGSSGSLLLASYLDGHENVLMLPALCGTHIYNFFELYQSLPLADKLIAYPAYKLIAHKGNEHQFFAGDFAISPTQYYAAVKGIVELYSEWPPDFVSSRRAFFLFVHIAYNLALGRRPVSSHPVIIYQQHHWNNALARQLVEDFPQAKFIHSIRDPIMVFDRMFVGWLRGAERRLLNEPSQDSNETRSLAKNPVSSVAPWWVTAFQNLVDRDRPHLGMESRTVAIRFEDLHLDINETMRDLSDWIGISYQATLLDSTFNGIPYVVKRDGKAWSGVCAAQAQRNPRYVSLKDRVLLFALFYEDFVAWSYPHPKRFGNPIIRCIVFLALFLIPLKLEIAVEWTVFKRKILPSVRHGNISIVIKFLFHIVFYRLVIICLFVSECFGRVAHGKKLLEVNHQRRRTGQVCVS